MQTAYDLERNVTETLTVNYIVVYFALRCPDRSSSLPSTSRIWRVYLFISYSPTTLGHANTPGASAQWG